jgi:hypothetical protein
MAFLLLHLTSKNSFIHFLNSLLNEGGQIMKWMTLVLVAVMFFCGSAFGATLNLKATWTANTEPDMKEYRLYRTDGTRTLTGTISHPSTSYNFSVTVPDQSAGTLTFVLTAVDTNNNESLDSTPASYSYNIDTIPPAAPKNLNVQKQ